METGPSLYNLVPFFPIFFAVCDTNFVGFAIIIFFS